MNTPGPTGDHADLEAAYAALVAAGAALRAELSRNPILQDAREAYAANRSAPAAYDAAYAAARAGAASAPAYDAARAVYAAERAAYDAARAALVAERAAYDAGRGVA